jgi:methionyl-tRNA formyltransferase
MTLNVLLFTSQDIGYDVVSSFGARSELSLLVIADRTPRDDLYGYRSAIDASNQLGIPCVKATRVDGDLERRIAAFAPDIIVSVYYPHIIPERILGLSRTVAINLHPGILPFYRGKFPTPWYILNGEKQFGLAIHALDSGVDTGPVFVQQLYDTPPRITGHELYRLTMQHGAKLIGDHLLDIASGHLKPRPQVGVGSYYGAIDRSFHIDWNLSRETIDRRIRVHAKPYLPAYTRLFNRMVFINRATPVDIVGYTAQRAGRILEVRPGGAFVVSGADGCLLVEDYEFAPALHDTEIAHHLRVGNQFGQGN